MAGAGFWSCWNQFAHHLSENKYPMYVVFVMMLLLASNQISRYVIVATNVQMANDIKFGDKECRSIERHVPRKEDGCRKNETFGVPVGIILERKRNNRKNVIATCAISWSFMLVYGSLAMSYWHLAMTRIGVALFEAAFTAFAVSLISSYVPQYLRALALSVFMWGAHFGFSMAFVIKMVASRAGWRHAYIVTGLPGLLLGVLTYCTIKDPGHDMKPVIAVKKIGNGTLHDHREFRVKPEERCSLRPSQFCNTLFVALVIGGAIRCGGGHTFYYNIHNFINHYYPGFPVEYFLSWIPAVAGLLGSLTGGGLADRIATHSQQGYVGRLQVIFISVMLSIPCALLVLSLPPPWSFIMLIPGYFINEMWSGIIVTVIVEQAPPGRETSAMVVYGFTVNVIGGNLALFLPALRKMYNWKTAMFILWPGAYTCSVLLFAYAIVLAKRRTIATTKHCHVDKSEEFILQISNGKR